MDPALLQQIMGAGPLGQQQTQADQELTDLIARRRAIQAQPRTTGLGALLSGIGDIIMGNKEGDLRARQADLARQVADRRGAYANAWGDATAPVQAPPGQSPAQQFGTPFLNAPNTALAPLQDKGQAEQGQQRDLSQLKTAGMLSGDPMIAGYVQHEPQARMTEEQIGQSRLMQAIEKQKMEQAGPQAALGGDTPNVFALLTHRDQVPKVSSDIYGRYNARTGQPIATGSGGPEALLSPEAIDQSAALYLKTGQLPAMGRANPVLHGAILKRAAELSGGADVGASRADYSASKGSLAKAQTQADAIESFENTALKNLDQFLATAHGVIDTGSPLLNAPIRSLSNKVMGDTNMTKFNTARQVAIQEISKVLGGAVQGGAVTEGQRHEVEGLIRGDASVAQIEAAANILKTDMANRKASVNAQLATIRGRMTGKAPAPEAPTAAAPPDAAALRKKYGL